MVKILEFPKKITTKTNVFISDKLFNEYIYLYETLLELRVVYDECNEVEDIDIMINLEYEMEQLYARILEIENMVKYDTF